MSNHDLEILSISDIHIGAFDSEILMHELEKVFLEYIDMHKNINLITINGDTYDDKLSLHSKDGLMSIIFIKKLLKRAQENNFKIRIIKGTKSHDNDQLKILEQIAEEYSDVDFKVYYRVTEEEIFKDVRVLFIPEEYIDIPVNEYYKDYLSVEKRYDMIFAHGLLKEASFTASKQESEIMHPKAPILDTKEFLNACKGFMSLGHIHTHMTIKKDAMYTSSFSRWQHGEENPKGFIHYKYNTETNNYDYEFIENYLARKFITLELGIDDKIFNDNVMETIDNILWITQEIEAHSIKIKLNIPPEYPNTKLLIDSMKEILVKRKDIILDIRNEKTIKQEEEVEERINILLDKYGYIFDKNIPDEEKIKMYIKERYGKDIELDTVRNFIYKTK